MRLWYSWLALLVVGGCATSPRPAEDARFQRLADDFVASHFAIRPLEGVALGWHQYDGQYVVWNRDVLAAERARLDRFQREFATFKPAELSATNAHDLRLLQATLTDLTWGFDVQRKYWRNPMFYAGGVDILIYFKRDFAPLPDRVRKAAAVLRQAPAHFAAARQNLEPELPRHFINTALEIIDGAAGFLDKEATVEARRANDPAAVAEFIAARDIAVAEFKGFAAWLKAERLPRSNDRFALGRDGFAAMLRAELIELSPEQILELGMKELRAEQARFAAAARVIDPNRAPIDVFKVIQRDHPTEAGLIPDTRKNLEAIREFVVSRDLVTIPSPVRARVEETPPPQRATGFASMDTPGPFETKATEAYYYVTPTEPEWSAQQKEEWLTAFNFYTTDVVSIHEAYPGHYVQYLALNASGASTVSKVFSSYAFVEGWAHYTEQMVLEAGFEQVPAEAPREAQLRGARYRLAQSDEALLRLCRLCSAIKLHCHGATVEEATRFFVENCYYEEKPAHQEALRGTYDPGYLYYTLGKLQLLKLRSDVQAQAGAAFSLGRFHDSVLRHGMPPIRLLREQLLHDPSTWPEVL